MCARKCKADLVRAMAVDAGDQDDAPPVPKPLHLLASRLRGEERAVDVHVEDLRRRADGFSSATRRNAQHELASWNLFAEYVKHGSVGGRMPAPATHASILPSRSPIVFPIFHIPSYVVTVSKYAMQPQPICNPRVLQQREFELELRMATTRTHLVPYVRADILEPPLSAGARPSPQSLRELLHLRPLLVGRLGQVDAVHGPRARLDERERHLEPDPAVRARDERDAICERELAREDRRVRWSTSDRRYQR